jgi:hypothetical protein
MIKFLYNILFRLMLMCYIHKYPVVFLKLLKPLSIRLFIT